MAGLALRLSKGFMVDEVTSAKTAISQKGTLPSAENVDVDVDNNILLHNLGTGQT